MSKLVNMVASLAVVMIASLSVSAQVSIVNDAKDLNLTKECVQLSIGAELSNLPADVVAKIAEAKEKIEVAGNNAEMNSAFISTDPSAFLADLSKMEGIPEEVKAQIGAARADIVAQLSSRAEEMKIVLK